MSSSEAPPHRFTNAALVVLGLAVLVLAYALVTRVLSPRVDPVREGNPAGLVGGIIQVEVRNACGADGVAGTTMRFLRQHGFDVVEVGDHESFDVETSTVIDRVGDMEAAHKIAAALGIDDEHVVQDIQPGYYLDASVLIGRDYETLSPFSDR